MEHSNSRFHVLLRRTCCRKLGCKSHIAYHYDIVYERRRLWQQGGDEVVVGTFQTNGPIFWFPCQRVHLCSVGPWLQQLLGLWFCLERTRYGECGWYKNTRLWMMETTQEACSLRPQNF